MSKAPFKHGDAVRALVTFEVIRRGERYRVLRVQRDRLFPSGWVVGVWVMQPGRLPKRVDPFGAMIDSRSFEKL